MTASGVSRAKLLDGVGRINAHPLDAIASPVTYIAFITRVTPAILIVACARAQKRDISLPGGVCVAQSDTIGPSGWRSDAPRLRAMSGGRQCHISTGRPTTSLCGFLPSEVAVITSLTVYRNPGT